MASHSSTGAQLLIQLAAIPSHERQALIEGLITESIGDTPVSRKPFQKAPKPSKGQDDG